MWYLIILLLLAIFIFYFFSAGMKNPQPMNAVKYRVQFMTKWGMDPNINAPEQPHTGNMFLAVHDGTYRLFDVNQLASRGIANTSMFGTVDNLMRMSEEHPGIKQIYTSPVLMAPGRKDMEIHVDPRHSHISFSTMVAPSPDWFTGVSKVNLMQNGKWVNGMMIPLYVYDAGTDSGMGFFNMPDYPESRPKPVSMTTTRVIFPDGRPKPIAYLNIRRVQ